MTISLCKHSFCVLPPRGSIFNPGDCDGCGITYAACERELLRQQEALILGTARDGQCPDCRQSRRLFRYQPEARPWHSPDYQPPITYLCMSCWNAATNADNALYEGILAAEAEELNR